jgi:hypothetical protein
MTTFGPEIFATLQTAEGCPICEALSKVEFNLLAEFQFNTATHGEEFLDKNNGSYICKNHIQLFTKISAAKVAATLLYYLIEKGKAVPDQPPSTEICPICSKLAQIENSLVETYLTEVDHAPSGDFVCLQHISIIMTNSKFTKLTSPDEIYNKYAGSLSRLKEQLRTIQNKNYYLSAPEERSSIWRAVAKLTGKSFICQSRQ